IRVRCATTVEPSMVTAMETCAVGNRGFRIHLLRLALRLTYRRRGGRWSAQMIIEPRQTAERKARAAVRCRRIVKRSGHACYTGRSEEHTSELQSLRHLVCRLLLEKNNS